MRARSLLWACVLLFACRRGTLTGDGGTGVISTDGGTTDIRPGDGRTSDVAVVDARAANATTWSAWPMANHDTANTRRSPYVGPQAPIDRLALDGAGAGLVIGTDGTLYAVGWGDTYPVVAVDPATGAQLWSFAPPAPPPPSGVRPMSPSIAVGPEGNVYVAYRQGAFYALDRDGSVLWQFTTGKSGPSGDLSVFSAPVVAADGRVYVSDASVVYAFESDGRRVWQHDTHTIQGAAPTGLAADGTIYVLENYGYLSALSRDGAPLWTAAVTPAFSDLVVRNDRTLLYSNANSAIRQFGALDAAGKVLWQKSGTIAGFALGSDDAPYAGDGAGLVRMDRDGSVVWQAKTGSAWSIVDAQGTVYSASAGAIAAVDAGGVLKWELRTSDPAVPSSNLWVPGLYAIGSDGTLYASIGGTIHAIGGGGRCEGKPVDCDDRDPCTVDRCDPEAGCVHAPKCVGSPRCMAATCRPDGTCDFANFFEGVKCDDGIACSEGDYCRLGQCTSMTSYCAPVGAWPAGAHDAQRTRATVLLGPPTATTKWAAAVPGVSAFVVAADGTIYATDTQKIQSISPDGVATPLATVPALDLVLSQNGLYATTYGAANVLRLLGFDGLPQWSFESTPLSVPAIGPSGAVYVMARPDLIALGPDGSPLWKVRTGGGFAAPAVGPDGTIYALCPDLWAIAPDGRVKWKRSVGSSGNLVAGPAATYVMLDGSVRAIRADGTDAWSWSLGASATFAAALSAGNDLILTAGPTIYRLDALTGTQRSSVTPPVPAQTGQRLTAPILDGNEVLYVIANATDSNSFQPQTQVTVFAIDRTDQILWAAKLTRAMSAAGSTLAIGPDRTLYVTINNTLQAIGP